MQHFGEPLIYETGKGRVCVFPGLCKGCGLCIEKCPKKALRWSKYLGVYSTPTVEATEDCIACGMCQNVCPDCAILVIRDEGKKAAASGGS